VAQCTRLESVRVKALAGSNPASSARPHPKHWQSCFNFIIVKDMLPARGKLHKLLLVFSTALFGIFFLLSWQTANAQNISGNDGTATLGLATLVSTNLKNVKDGSVVSSSTKGAVLSIIPYDSQVLGIVSRDAAIQISTDNSKNTVPVISNGSVYVLVSSQQGNIQKGDYLTTSTIPGIGVKATKSGYVLGTAMEDYSSNDPKKSSLIAVDLNLHYFNTKPTLAGSLTDIFKLALLPNSTSLNPLFKDIVAAIVVLASLVLAFMTFGRTAAKGVEALGRNPAASKIIHLGIIFNVAIVVVIVLGGLTVAFMILRL
jgi:F0F1-type ATP synthase membrane subunit c/vacuolar-type H+-ATPase subunit K